MIGRSRLLIVLIFLSLVIVTSAYAERANYIYDDLGRLIKVVSDIGDVSVYNYDEVGNLISITRQAINQSPPVLQSISPDIVFTGRSVNVTITGDNLLTTTDMTSDNSGISISSVTSTDTAITALFTISSEAPLGQANINVTTPYGSASININVYKIDLTPAGTIYLLIGSTQNMTVNITPLPERDLNITITNKNSDIIETPLSINIPINESSSIFTVKAIKEGMGIIEIGGVNATIFVTPPFTGDASISSGSVCVNINILPSNSLIQSSPVNIQLGPVLGGGFSSPPISVQLLQIPGAIVVSGPVCIKISNQ